MEQILIRLSIALMGGLLMSRPAKKLGLPAVTAYLITGLLLGPFCLGSLGISGLGFASLDQVAGFNIISQAAQSRNKPAVTLTEAMRKLDELLGEENAATLEQVETLQTLEGISQTTLYRARQELALKTVSIGKPPARKTWWVRYDVDVEWFKVIHTPDLEPMEQLELST